MISAYKREDRLFTTRHYLIFLFVLASILMNTTQASEANNQKITCDALEEGAKTGNSYLELSYGHCFVSGSGRPKNIKLAEYWYKKAINGGEVSAKISLASLYLFHFDDEKKKKLAVNLLREPIDKGYSKAIFVMGVAFHNGLGIAKDNSKALEYYKEAAEKWHKLGAAACYLVSKDNLYHLEHEKLATDFCLKLLKRNLSMLKPESVDKFLNQAINEEFVQKYVLNDN